MIEAAAIVSAIINHWDDFAIIIALLLFNACIEMWQDRKASNALAALKKGLAPTATVLRDGKFTTIPAVNQFRAIQLKYVQGRSFLLICALLAEIMHRLTKLL